MLSISNMEDKDTISRISFNTFFWHFRAFLCEQKIPQHSILSLSYLIYHEKDYYIYINPFTKFCSILNLRVLNHPNLQWVVYSELCRRTWSVPVDCILHTSETPSLLETDVWRHSVHKLWTWRQMPIHKIIFAKSEKNIKENVYFYMVRLNFAILNKLNCDELQTIFIIPSIASFFGM